MDDMANLSAQDQNELRHAKTLLENPGLAAKIGNYLGSPIEATLKRLPESVNAKINDVAKTSIEKALDIAILTMDKGERGFGGAHQVRQVTRVARQP
jgi:hypothetical protein